MAELRWLRIPFHRLRFRLLMLLMLALAPAFILQLMHAAAERSTQAQWVKRDTQRVAQISAGSLIQYVEGARKLAMTVSSFPAVVNRDPAECERMFQSITRQYPEYVNVSLLDLSGHWIAAARELLPGPRGEVPWVGDLDWFKTCVQEKRFVIGSFISNTFVGQPLLPFANPVYDGQRKLVAVLVIALNLKTLESSIEKTAPPEGYETIVFDQHGTILAHHPGNQGWVGRSAAFLSSVPIMLQNLRGTVEETDPGGKKLVVGFSEVFSMKTNALFVQARRPAGAAFKPISDTLWRSFFSLLVGGLLALIAAWLGSDAFVLRQLRAVGEAATKLAHGDLRARSAAPHGIAEVNQLAKTFDAMAQQLEARETERRLVLVALRNSEDQLRALSAHLQSVREQESTRIARELHDELGQVLAAMRINLETLRDPALSPADAAGRIEELGALADETIQRVRRICSELRPGVLDELGVVAATQWLAEDFENRSQIPCTFLCRAESISVPPESATAIFRTCQEALTNVMRHSDASSVTIELSETEDHATLRIRDDGQGFDVTSVRPGESFGILGMRERVALAGGRFSLVSIPAVGTTISVSFSKELAAAELAAPELS